jgi:hypothetical protein
MRRTLAHHPPSDPVPTLSQVRRLRPLTEAECYARCYGAWEATVQLVRVEQRGARDLPELTGEELRLLFEDRLELREYDEAEAA